MFGRATISWALAHILVVIVMQHFCVNDVWQFGFIFRPHRSTAYVDAAYCYDRVAWSVSQSVTLVSRAKMAEPIEMPFGFWARLG